MICYKCGSHVPDGSKICPTCGNNFEKDIKKPEIKGKSSSGVKETVGFNIGDLVAGRYKIKSRIGEGPCGVIFRVLDTEMDVDIALKLLYKSVIGNEADNKKFQAEMRIARKIAHQNIVRVYDIDRDNGYSFYTMQLLEGLTLKKIINLRAEKKQVFSLQEIEPIFVQIYNALSSAQNFTFHGNLKPENIMILPDLLKVCDFSLVKAVGFEKFTELNSANLNYIAPEIKYNWDTVDSRSDIYSMAAIIYEMVSGEKFKSLPVSASLKNPNVPKAIDGFLNKALSEEQDKRFDNLNEFIEEFKKIVDKEASQEAEEGPEDEEFIEISTDDFELLETQEREKTRKRLPKDRIFFSVEEELKRKKTDQNEDFEEDREIRVEKKKSIKTTQPIEEEEDEEPAEKPVVSKPSKREVEREDREDREDIIVKKRPALSTKEEPKITPRTELKIETAKKDSAPPSSGAGGGSNKSMIVPMMILVIVLAVLGGGVFLLYKAMENQRERDRIMLEQQRMEIEKQRMALEKYQQELMAQLEATKKSLSQAGPETTKPKTVEELKKEEEDKKKLMELEARLSELQKEKENLDKKKEEIKVKEKPRKDEKPRITEEPAKKKEKPQKEVEPPKKVEIVKAEEKKEEKKEAPLPVVEEKKEESKPIEKEEVKQEETQPAPTEKKPQCPKGMILIPEGSFMMGSSPSDPMRGFGEKNSTEVTTQAYCIDIFEYPNKRGATPRTNVSQSEAEALCQKAGKRLCSEEEWEKACKGPGNAKFAYGNTFVAGKCNTADAEGNKGGLQASGSFPGCVSGYGAFDMSGNAAEITKTATKGGSADKADYASRCSARIAKSAASPMTGFRCCADPK